MTGVARRPVAERLRRWLIARCAPISIDGQTVEAITIDGQDVSEVTMDGQTVFEDAIPDSVVSRPDDDDSGSSSDVSLGLEISTSQEWPDIQIRISSNQRTASDEEAVIEESSSGTEILSQDVSSNSNGDVITLSGASLASNTNYLIYLRTPNNNNRQTGFFTDSPSFPYVSSDGNLEITSGWLEGDGLRSDAVYGIDKVGNINL